MMNLISFYENQTREILKLIDIDASKEVIGRCECCKKELNLRNIGSIARSHARNVLFCDSPICFAGEIAKQYCKDVNVLEEDS